MVASVFVFGWSGLPNRLVFVGSHAVVTDLAPLHFTSGFSETLLCGLAQNHLRRAATDN